MRPKILFLLLLSLLTFSTLAQEDFSNDTFSFAYPDDWEITEQSETSVLFSAPIAATGAGQTGDFSIQTEGMGIFVIVEETSLNALELAESEIEEIAGDGVFTAEPLIELVINDRDAAMVDANSMLLSWRIITMSLDEEYVVLVIMTGVDEQFNQATPIVLDILNSVRVAGDDTPIDPLIASITLEETHTRPDGNMAFDYPAGWEVTEEETYTLLIIPDNDVTIGLSSTAYPEDVPVDEAELSSIVAEFIDVVTNQYPSFDVIDDGTVLTLNEDQLAVSALLVDPEDGFAYGYIVFSFGENNLGRVTIIGSSTGMTSLLDTPLAIAASVKVPNASHAESRASP